MIIANALVLLLLQMLLPLDWFLLKIFKIQFLLSVVSADKELGNRIVKKAIVNKITKKALICVKHAVSY